MLKLTTDKHKASRGLSATAELLVESVLMLLTEKLSNFVYACRNYSLSKLAHFLRHSVVAYICFLVLYNKLID